MADWESKKLTDVVTDIDNETIVLPVIQRNLVWEEEKMELLFDSLLKGNPFGGIMAIEEKANTKPLFAFRKFSRDGMMHDSIHQEKLFRPITLIVDGQQRLQSFYMGLIGSINDKSLYFNLFSQEDYEFEFAHQEKDLYSATNENGSTQLWYPVKVLYSQLEQVNYVENVVKDVMGERTDLTEQDLIRRNIHAFWKAIFSDHAIGISRITVEKNDPDGERRRMVELFRRLNDGGTRLSTMDMAASILKGFDERLEGFLRREVPQYEDIGFGQDEVIRLLFLLRGDAKKDIMDIGQEDADYAIKNKDRLLITLNVLRQFLVDAELYEYFRDGSRSDIPLYFIAYHIFHKNVADRDLEDFYVNHDVNNVDFVNIKRWIYLSLLNGVFSRGKGWIPYKTGINKILGVMQNHRNSLFPTNELFEMYRGHPLNFSTAINKDRMSHWDLGFLFYLMYDCKSRAGRDIDHIQPRSLLEGRKVAPQLIHSPANYQLLDEERNRNVKRAKQFKDWIAAVDPSVRSNYLNRHLIPQNPELWALERFEDMLDARADLIINKTKEQIPAQAVPSQSFVQHATSTQSVSAAPMPKMPISLDKAALIAALPEDCRNHPILNDVTTWEYVFGKLTGCGKSWTTRYRKELASSQIVTIGDFALLIMNLGIKFSHVDTFGTVYIFAKPLPDGTRPSLKTNNFGGWAWGVALQQIEERGLLWEDYLVK